MKIEIVDDLVEQLADWFGVYGGCKNNEEDEDCESKCTFNPEKPFCCRSGFTTEMEERIRQAVKNEDALNKLYLIKSGEYTCDCNENQWCKSCYSEKKDSILDI